MFGQFSILHFSAEWLRVLNAESLYSTDVSRATLPPETQQAPHDETEKHLVVQQHQRWSLEDLNENEDATGRRGLAMGMVGGHRLVLGWLVANPGAIH